LTHLFLLVIKTHERERGEARQTDELDAVLEGGDFVFAIDLCGHLTPLFEVDSLKANYTLLSRLVLVERGVVEAGVWEEFGAVCKHLHNSRARAKWLDRIYVCI
jgi:hypothetical protein